MKNTKQSITFKVIFGYFLLALLAGLAVWFIYTQVLRFSDITQSNSRNNQQLVLVSEIATKLYETESTGRRFIQSGDTTDLKKYSLKIDSIQTSINSLRSTYDDSIMRVELDSITILLSKKTSNLEELLLLRSRDRNTNYYTEVIQELQRVDESFKETDYENRFPNLQPYQRRVLIQILEFSKDENQELSKVSADSLVRSVKKVLTELARENQQFRNVIDKKENELLDNDLVLNEQLRNLLSVIELEERQTSLQRAQNSQILLKEVSRIILIAGVISIFVILLFPFLIVRDVSRSQRYRMELEDAKAFTESLMRRREQFIAAITHDLRSPLNTVIGYSELMEKSGLNPKQENYLGYLKKSSEYILHLVNDLLDLSKLDAGKMLIEQLPFNPGNLLKETFQNTIPADSKKDLNLEVIIEDSANCQVLSDPFRIKQILSNLIANAYKFTDTGSIVASAKMKKEIENSYVLIFSIKDTGIGISKSKQEDIFEEFSQEHAKIEKQFGGTGLGLAITKRLAGLLNGSVELDSAAGKGSEFIISIPVVKLSEKSIVKKEKTPKNFNLAGKKVLVIDDEAAQLALTKELIKSVGMECTTTPSGLEALEMLRDEEYHLVITDIQMPVMDGFELIKEIKSDPEISKTPVIAVSGRTNLEPNVYRNAGFSGNILKPYKPNKLLNKIGEILEVEIESSPVDNSLPKKMKNGYSLTEIKEFAGDDKVALNTIISAFIESTRLNMKEIELAETRDNFEKIGSIAHRMMPMFKQLGVDEIVVKLQILEHQDIKQPSQVKIKTLVSEIDVLLDKLETEIKV